MKKITMSILVGLTFAACLFGKPASEYVQGKASEAVESRINSLFEVPGNIDVN